MNYFNLTSGYFENLLLWRVHFVDSDRFLIKFGNQDAIVGRSAESSVTQTAFFVLYNYKTTLVENIFENSSRDFLDYYTAFDIHLGNRTNSMQGFVSGPSNDAFALKARDQQMYAVTKARNGGSAQSVKRMVSGAPFNPQNFNESPYFDHTLFTWDEKLIDSLDKARPCSEFPVKFYCRESGKLAFKIDPHAIPYGSNPSAPSYRSSKYVILILW